MIPHPGAHALLAPDNGKEWKLKHTCIESNHPLLLYRQTIEMTKLTHRFEMPQSWFPHIVTDVTVHCTPYKHFGSAWGQVLEDCYTIEVHASVVGKWHVLLTGIRNDEVGKQCINTPIEFQDEIPPDDSDVKEDEKTIDIKDETQLI